MQSEALPAEMTIIEVKPHRWAGKFLSPWALSQKRAKCESGRVQIANFSLRIAGSVLI
jgi:hypothetical protein